MTTLAEIIARDAEAQWSITEPLSPGGMARRDRRYLLSLLREARDALNASMEWMCADSKDYETALSVLDRLSALDAVGEKT